MAFQVWSCHLSSWRINLFPSYISLPSKEKYEALACWATTTWICFKNQTEKKNKNKFRHAGGNWQGLNISRMKEHIPPKRTEKEENKRKNLARSHFEHNRSDTAKNRRKQDQLLRYAVPIRGTFSGAYENHWVQLSSLDAFSDSYWSHANRIHTGNIKSPGKRDRICQCEIERTASEYKAG